ncbi:MAG: MFS transporter [Patescibacteria group bacterium]|nr:MFS transporter [Patescibacteria group bacterium]
MKYLSSIVLGKYQFFNRPLRILLLSNATILVAGAMLGPISALFIEKIGGDLLDASFAGGIFALAAGVTVLLAGTYTDKIKEKELVVVFGYLTVGIGFLLYTLVNSVWFLLTVQVLVGFGEAIYAPAFDATYSKHLDKGKTGKEWGAWESANYFSVAIGALGGGFIVTNLGFTALFLIMSFLCFASATYIYHLPRKIL